MIFTDERDARLMRALRRAEETRRARREAGEIVEAGEIAEAVPVHPEEVVAPEEIIELRKAVEAIPVAANETIPVRLRRRRRKRGTARLAMALFVIAAVAAFVAWRLYPSGEPSRPGPYLKLEKRLHDPRS
jgi:hypothetical protein